MNNENKDMVNNLLDLLFDEGNWVETGEDLDNILLDAIYEEKTY